jgi:hypothetical protein
MRLLAFLLFAGTILSTQAHAKDPVVPFVFDAYIPLANLKAEGLAEYSFEYVNGGEPFFIFNSSIDPKPIAISIDIEQRQFRLWGTHQTAGKIVVEPGGGGGEPDMVTLKMDSGSPYQEFRFYARKEKLSDSQPRKLHIFLGTEDGMRSKIGYGKASSEVQFAVGDLAQEYFRKMKNPACDLMTAFASI